MGNLKTPEDVQKLRTALHTKAKEEPEYRFYLLYDKIHRRDVLEHAYRCCKTNNGAAGVDGIRFEDIEAYGEERWLGELAERLRRKDYRPEAVKRVWIPKPDGKLRPLGIPTITDRVVQTAAMIVLDPIFEADLQPEQFAYRERTGAHDAIKAVHRLLSTGHQQIIDADLSGYFDSIPHAELVKCVARRVSDKHVLHLIKLWLDTPVEEDDGHGNRIGHVRFDERGLETGCCRKAQATAPVLDSTEDADPKLLKAARAAAVVCRVVAEDLITHRHDDPHFSDLKKIDAILADIRTRLGEPEPEPIPLDPKMEATLEKLEKDWQAPPHKPRERER